MKSLHIAFFNRAFSPEVSATGQLLTELARGLVEDHGARVSVVTGIPLGVIHGSWSPPHGWCLIGQERWKGISILRARGTSFSKRTLVGRMVNYLTYFGSACWAGLKLKHPDVVIALTDPPIIGLAALMAARRFRAKLVISYRDLFPEAARLLEVLRSPFIEKALRSINQILIRHADALVALGETMRRRLIEEKGAPASRVSVIPDWADCSAIRPVDKRNPFSLAHDLADCFVVMHAGNLGLSQNLDTLLAAADHLRDLPDLKVVLVGDGVRKASLQDQAKQRGLTQVQFLPYSPKEDLSNTFSAADCFIISLKPGLAGYIMPSKLYGILAAGRPYVAAVDDECDVARLTHEHQCGLVAKPGDPADLAEKIRLLYNDRSLLQRLGTNARDAASAFDRPKGVKAYWDLCCSLTGG